MKKSRPSFLKSRALLVVASTLFASTSTLLLPTKVGAWNSTDIAVGSHPVAQSFFMSHDVDIDGNTVTAFQIQSPNRTETTDVEPGNGVTELVTTGSMDAVITKFNSAGTFQWAYHIVGSGTDVTASDVSPRSIKTDSAGNIYLAGTFNRSVDFDGSATSTVGDLTSTPDQSSFFQDGFILKLNPEGVFQWVTRTKVSGYFLFTGIDVDASGNVYIAGNFNNAVENDVPTDSTDLDYRDGSASADLVTSSGGFVAKYNSSGLLQWTYEFPAEAEDIVVSGTRVMLAGTFGGSGIDFDPSSGVNALSAGGFIDIFIVELTTDGVFQTVRHIKGGVYGDQMTSPRVRIASDSSIIVSGILIGNGLAGGGANFSPPTAETFRPFVGRNGSGNGFVVKYSPTYVFQWVSVLVPVSPFTTSPLQRPDIYGIDVTDDGGVVLGGALLGKVDLDPGSGVDEFTSVPATPDTDAFVMKLNSSGEREWVNVLTNTSAKVVWAVVERNGYITSYGSFGGTLDFDPSPATYNVTAGGTSAFIWRVDRTGMSAPVTLPQPQDSNNDSPDSGSGDSTPSSGSGSTGSTTNSQTTSTTLTDAQIAAFKAATLVQGSQVIAGQSYTVTADGFAPSETVNGYLQGSSSSIGSKAANSVGKASVSIKIPANATGKKTLYLYGARSGHGVRQTITINKAATVLPATGNNLDVMWFAVWALSGGLVALSLAQRRRRVL